MALGGVVWLILAASPEGPCGDAGVCLDLFLSTKTWPTDLAIGLGVALAILALWEAARRTLPIAAAMEQRLAEIIGSVPGDEALALALISGFSEELFFRGAIQASLGWFLATIVFAAVHTGPGRALRFWTVYAGIAGLILAGLMEWRGNLLAPIVTHVVVNAFGLWRLRSKPPSPTPPEAPHESPEPPSPLLNSEDESARTSHRIE